MIGDALHWFAQLGPYFEPLARGITLTLALTFGAFVLGAVLAIPLALGRVSRNAVARGLSRLYIELVRGVPPLMWLFLIYYGLAVNVVKLGTKTAAIVGLGLIAAAYLAEVYRSGVKAIPRGQWEAAQAVGLRRVSTYIRVIAPQAIFIVIPPAAAYAIALLKDSSVASIIGAQEITFHALRETQRTFDGLHVFMVAAIIYVGLSLPVAIFARWTDQRLSSYLQR